MRLPPCPTCHAMLPADLMRVGEDLAPCPACGGTHRLSELAAQVDQRAEVEETRRLAAEAPAGAWRRFEADRVYLGATHRSLGTALVLLGLGRFWNGIVSVFVFFASAGTLLLLGFQLPAVAEKIHFEGESGPPGWGLIVFLWLFLTPFILIGAAIVWGFINALGGRTELMVSPGGATLSTGIGPLGRTRRFEPHRVRAVRTEEKISRGEDSDTVTTLLVIELEGAKPLRFGSGLTEARREFLLAALRELLTPPPSDRSAATRR